MINKSIFSNQRGFTLVEALVVAFMLGLVMASIYSLYALHARTAYVQDEVVEVQQNLRVAMDSITNDLRHAGFVISQRRERRNPDPIFSPTLTEPIRTVTDMSAAVILPNTPDLLGGPPVRHADTLALNTSSTDIIMCKIATTRQGPGIFSVTTQECLDGLDPANGPTFVRILNPTSHEQNTNLQQDPSPAPGTGQGTVFQVTQVNKPLREITLVETSGFNSATTWFKRADMIIKIPASNAPCPSTIQYCLGPVAGCGLGAVTCNQIPGDPTLCLIKIENGTSRAVASRISGLQFTYLMDDGLELSTNALLLPGTDFGAIRAVRVGITGQTQNVVQLTGRTFAEEAVRSLTAVVKLKNRYKGL